MLIGNLITRLKAVCVTGHQEDWLTDYRGSMSFSVKKVLVLSQGRKGKTEHKVDKLTSVLFGLEKTKQ